MYRVRKIKTSSGATAVQVIRYADRKRIVVKHIGSSNKDEELIILWQMAQDWIKQSTGQKSLLTVEQPQNPRFLQIEKCEYLGIHYTFIYEVLSKLLERFGFCQIGASLLCDLVIIRIIEPASKLQSLDLLKEYFGIYHRRQTFYETLPKLILLKDSIEKLTVKRAIEELNFDFSLVFYDVTTLYFESFSPDELRRNGFSKDNKSQQPQIVIGLVVTREGFPVAYDVFPGNKFEGHTLIPIIEDFKNKHNIKTLTVVADAAMISLENITALENKGLNYIVGARLGNISPKRQKNISQSLNHRHEATIRVATAYGSLICDFSRKRYVKDEKEMNKQIKKAEALIKKPTAVKRAKFIKNNDQASYEINQKLVEKTKLLLGIKGYYTNLESVDNKEVINHYHNLWRIEQAFRIAKNDLEMRPIFHFKEEPIKVHLIICFMALAVSKYMEIKTARALPQILKLFKKITDARILDTTSNKEIIMRVKLDEKVENLLNELALPH